MSTAMHLVCAKCSAVNRVARTRLVEAPKCGKCANSPFKNGSLLRARWIWPDFRPDFVK